MSESLSAYIRRRRKELGYDTQAALARAVGVSQQSVARWERGEAVPSPAVRARLMTILGLDDADVGCELTEVAREERAAKLPVRPLLSRLPLDQLTPADFERLTHALTGAVYPEASQVHRVGGPGHAQSGADVIAEGTRDGRVLLQCKRLSRDGRFGPSMVVRAASAAEGQHANRRILVLSRVASPQARAAATELGWIIWDHDDIVQLLQTRVAAEQARRIVRTFFPNHARDFLGVAAAGPWLSLEEMYAGQLNREGLFTHKWHLLGRDAELAELLAWLNVSDDSSAPCRLLVGSAGVGKSRLLIETARRVASDIRVWFVDSNVEVRPEDFDTLDQGPVLLVVDDAHERQDLEVVLRGALQRNQGVRTLVLLATRPYGKDSVSRVTARFLGGGLPEATTLHRLDRSAARQLAAHVLDVSPDSTQAHNVVAVAGDSTMLTVAAALMLKEKRLNPALMARADEVRHLVLGAWVEEHARALTGLPPGVDPRAFLQSLAAVQPLELSSGEHIDALAALAGIKQSDDVVRAIGHAVAVGVASQRAGRVRLMPDMLADFVLADACYDIRLSRPTGFADRVWRQAPPSLRRNLLVNLSRVDWQLSVTGHTSGSLIDLAWASLEAEFRNAGIEDRCALLSLVAEVAHFQPRRSLELARWAMENPLDGNETGFLGRPVTYEEVKHSVPRVLRGCAYDADCLDESLDLLWQLARDDTRPTNQYPDHPKRVLSELASFSLLKPFEYSKRVLERAVGWLARDRRPAVFEILSEATKWDAEDHLADGLVLHMRSYSALRVAPEADVLALRRHVIDALIESAFSPIPGVATAAIRVLGDSFRRPGGLFGREADAAEVLAWERETISTLRQVAQTDKLPALLPIVKAELRDIGEGLLRIGSAEVDEAARELLEAIGSDLDMEVAEALHHGPWRRTLRDSGESARSAEQDWLRDVASRLLEREGDTAAVADVIERALGELDSLPGEGSSHPGPLVAALVELDASLVSAIADRILSDPHSPLGSILGIALSSLRRRDADEAMRIAQGLLATDNPAIHRQIAYAYGWGLGPVPAASDAEMKLIRSLAADDDLVVARNIAGGLRFIGTVDPTSAVEVMLELRIGRSPDLADETLMLFAKGEVLSLERLDESSLERILAQLTLCPRIDEYWVEQFLGLLGQRDLERVVQLLRDRVERAERLDYSSDEYRPLPFGWEDRSPFSTVGYPDRRKVLRDLVEWSVQDVPGWRRHFDGPRLFAAVAGGFDDEVLSVLEEALAAWPLSVAKRAAHLLSETPKSVIWERVSWVSRVLESAAARDSVLYKALASALWAAAVGGVKSGSPGQPYPQDVEQRDRARVIADGLPAGSAAERFYRTLQRSAEAEISRKLEEDEELF